MLTEPVLAAAAAAADRLRERGQTVAVAESSTGGLIAAALVAQDGASAYFRGGFVFYTLVSLKQLGRVSALEFGERSATEPRARWAADSARIRLEADWGVGETGATGPTPNPYGDPAGHSWVAAVGPDGVTSAHVLTGSDDRVSNMEAFAVRALQLVAAG